MKFELLVIYIDDVSYFMDKSVWQESKCRLFNHKIACLV